MCPAGYFSEIVQIAERSLVLEKPRDGSLIWILFRTVGFFIGWFSKTVGFLDLHHIGLFVAIKCFLC